MFCFLYINIYRFNFNWQKHTFDKKKRRERQIKQREGKGEKGCESTMQDGKAVKMKDKRKRRTQNKQTAPG